MTFLFFSQTFNEHIKHLELVFEELINNGLVVIIKKIKLFKVLNVFFIEVLKVIYYVLCTHDDKQRLWFH